MGIFDSLFGGGSAPQQPAQAQQPQQAQPGQQPQQGTPGNIPNNPNQLTQQSDNTAPNGVVPAQTQSAESPMDQFKDLWQAPENQPNPNAPLLNVDPKKLGDAARRTDFSKMINPQLFEKIQAGGAEASQAFAQAMNQVAQGVYAQSAFASSKIVEAAVAKAREQIMADMPNHVKKQQVSDSLRTENPAFSHPAAQPIISAIEKQIQMKFPNATASEISGMAKQYMQNFANIVSPQTTQQSAQKGNGKDDTDWSTFIN